MQRSGCARCDSDLSRAGGGLQSLAAPVGPAVVVQISVTNSLAGRSLTGKSALAIGVVDRIFPAAEFVEVFGAFAHKITHIALAARSLFVAENSTVVGFPAADALAHLAPTEPAVDVLVPAAFEAVPHEGNAARVEARIVVDGANGPTSPAAELIPADAGVLVVPDILANASGVIVSHFEWMQANQAYWWDEGEVEMCRAKRMNSARHRVLGHSIERGVTRRTAATVLAVERVVQAHRLRGLYP